MCRHNNEGKSTDWHDWQYWRRKHKLTVFTHSNSCVEPCRLELPYTFMIRKHDTWTKMWICAIDDSFLSGPSYYQTHIPQSHSSHFWIYNFWQMCTMIPRLQDLKTHKTPNQYSKELTCRKGCPWLTGLIHCDAPQVILIPFTHQIACLSFYCNVT